MLSRAGEGGKAAARSGHCDDITTNRLFYFIMLKMLKIDFSSPFFPSLRLILPGASEEKGKSFALTL
jgi:hypothetical protein